MSTAGDEPGRGGPTDAPGDDDEAVDERPNAARIYDWLLGGGHNLAADRETGRELLERDPNVVTWARANRDFLRRAVRWCLEHGIDQFLDLGSGVPTVGNVHEIVATSGVPGRVAYVEVEAVAVAASRDLLAGAPGTSITHADLRDVDTVLSSPGVTALLDPTRPWALLAVAVLHFLDDADDVAAILGRYRRVLPPGSAVVISHNSDDHDDPDLVAAMRAAVAAMAGTANPVRTRTRAELLALLDGLELVDPGLVPVAAWRPDARRPSAISPTYGAVALTPR